MIDKPSIREVEAFLYDEAAMLDERRFDDWLELLTEDVRYWMPIRRNVSDKEASLAYTQEGREAAWFDEGKATLSQRVKQLATGVHWCEVPVSRISRLLTNIRITAAGVAQTSVECRFFVHRNRNDIETDLFVGKRRDVLRVVGGGLKIARREIFLEQNVLMSKNITFLL